ncbi:Unknown protein [Striga hermonthica]|uniref:F-box/LRR-repeat protein 15/At3g58940/PEG3-like LRR domain-containing protein n=1 Tax=Striga hermonthica TaxID=68872 RepID=A0A9N7RCR6_STRHE|nr:Unknown protein [Striga hermonthica]
MDEEFHLPEHIIHRIQSFLTGKEATRTSILSNAWHHAALTRPNLDFDVHDFRTGRDEDEPYTGSSDDKFSKFVRMTISRYEQLKLKIGSLRFREYTEWGDTDDDVTCSHVVYKELIPKALSMGATRLDIGGDFMLPNEVFEAENLVRLSVEKCRIDLNPLDRPAAVRCPRLESLSLSHVDIVKPNQIYRIISGCPSIKKLFFVNNVCYTCLVGVGIANSHMLTCLLCDMTFLNFVTMGDLSSKFPFLKHLTLHDFWAYPKEIVISSRSLERLNFICFEQYSEKKIRFDVPSLDKFTYKGPLIHHISFAPTSKFRVSRLAIEENDGLSTAWFGKLENLVKELGRSEIHICLSLGSKAILDYEADEFQRVSKPEVDSVTVHMDGLSSITCYVLFDGLFRIFRPKIIAHYILPESSCGRKTNNDLLGKTLLEGLNGKFSAIGSHFIMWSVNDIKEVNVQLLDDDDVGVWTPLSWDSFLDASRSTYRKRDVRFQLAWKP